MATETKKLKTIRAEVVSDKMDKTVVARVRRTFKHPRLKKVMRIDKKYKVHDENNEARTGDLIDIYEGKPQAKSKFMYLARIVQSQAQ